MNTVVVKPADNGRMEQQLERLLHQIMHAVSCHFWSRKLEYIYNKNPLSSNLIFYKRHIDDIYSIWTGDDDDLDRFVDYLNNLIPTIKFKMEASCKKIHFLDTYVHVDDNPLFMTLYRKPTDNILNCGSSIASSMPKASFSFL